MSESVEIPTQTNTERRDATYPNKDPKGQKEWMEFIEENVDNFQGNIENASKLLMSYQKGRNFIYGKFSPKIENFKKPDIMIVLDESKVLGSFGSTSRMDKIFIKKSTLEQFSKLDQNALWGRGKDGKISMVATPSEIFELAGIEETHHSLFSEVKKSKKQPLDPNKTDSAIYDAQDHEYRALRWQIQYASENKFLKRTVDVLKKRLGEAQKVRLKKKRQA